MVLKKQLKNKETTLTFEKIEMRAIQTSSLGLVLNHLKSSETNTKKLIEDVLLNTYLPFAMDEDNPEYREKVIRCICNLEASIKAIQEYTGIAITQPSPLLIQETSEKVENRIFEDDLDTEDDEWEEEEDFVKFS